MLISIITTAFNSQDTILETIRSVNEQTYPHIEHIFIDGLSQDSTLSVIHKYSNRKTILLSEADTGLYDAMNKGISLAKGDVIGFLNSDDIYPNSDVIQTVSQHFLSSDSDVVYGDLIYFRDHPSQQLRIWKARNYVKGGFARGWHPPHPTFFARSELYNHYGGFDTSMSIAADFDLMMRFLELYQVKSTYIPEILVAMRMGGRSATFRGIKTGKYEILQSFKKNSITPMRGYFLKRYLSKILQGFNYFKS
jgi:glycosyltransferase involved in cell wall biosynthesis